MWVRFALVGTVMLAVSPAAAKPDVPPYTVVKNVALGAPDKWDYVAFDAPSGRVYVAHGDRLTVVDGQSGEIVGQVEGIPGGTHGTSISHETQQGFTDDGKEGTAIAFDLKTLRTTKRIHADVDADATVLDPSTGHLFVIEGDPGAITVIDPATDAVAATINVGEKLEFAASDGQGGLYVAGEEKGDVVRIDARTNKVTAHWATPACRSPHGLAIDKAGRRVFMGCANAVMTVVDADTGRIIANLTIGRGNDAVAWDPVRKRVFSSNGVDGTITAFQQRSPDNYEAMPVITTQVSGRTMDLDATTGRLFVAAADTDPSATPGGRPRTRPGTLRLMMLDPAE